MNAHRRLPAIDLQEAFAPVVPAKSIQPFGRDAVCEPVVAAYFLDPDVDLVRRFSHTIVLHWRVWADLVYLLEPGQGDQRHLPS